MKKYTFALLAFAILFAPLAQAEEEDLFEDPLFHQSTQNYGDDSYGDRVSEKALNGFTNINTAVLEIPKNIINTTNDSNVAFGFVGGAVKGILNTVGRMMTGLTDLITAPIITKPIVQPEYIWQDFDADSTYGPVFRLDNEPAKTTKTETSTKVVVEHSTVDRTEINRERDRVFKEEMMK